MKTMTKCVEEMVLQLSAKYGFDKAEALEFLMPAGEAVRGRPSKPKKKVVNKTEMVEDVIKTIMEEGGAASLSNPAVEAEAVTAQAEPVIVAAAVAEAPIKKKAAPKKKKAVEAVVVVEAVTEVQVEPVIVAAEGGLKGDAPLVDTPKEKKKAAPKKKKAEAVVKVVAQAEPVIVTSESGVTAYTVEEGEKTAKAVAALMEATKEDAKQKKKAAPKKKKAEAVVAQAELVTVAAVVVEEAPKEKKKAAPKKKKAEAPVTEVAVVAQAEPVTVASEGGVKGDTPLVEEAPKEKKKAAPKKKAEAPVTEVAVVAQTKPVTVAVAAVVEEAPKEKKKAAPKKKAEAPVVVVEAPKPAAVRSGYDWPKELSEEEVSADEEPAEKTAVGDEEDTPSDEDSTSVAEWTCKKDGKTYLKSCEDNCGEDTCDCAGEVYDAESQEVIGHWNGVTIEAPAWQAGDD